MMGNRALRKEASRLLGHRVYSGRKFAAFRYLSAARLRQIIAVLKIPTGSLMHDCDGFNHEVGSFYPEKCSVHPVRLKDDRVLARIVHLIDVYKLDGTPFCGCTRPQPHGKDLPTQGQIEEFWRDWLHYQQASASGWDDTVHVEEIRRRLSAGEPICDERGVQVPELVNAYQEAVRKAVAEALRDL